MIAPFYTRLLLLCLLGGFLLGCGNSIYRYPDHKGDSARFSFNAQGLSGGAFSSNDARIDFYGKADKDCIHPYLGSLEATDNTRTAQVPVNTPLFGSIVYNHSSFWSGRSRIDMDFIFTPKQGYRYNVSYTRRDNAYDISLLELNSKGQAREIPLEPWPECHPK